MLRSVSSLDGATVSATDGEIGSVKEAYFDDDKWTIRYLIVNTGTWFTGRDVLISPYSVKQPMTDRSVVDVSLTREQVKNSPDVDTHKPVSRQFEHSYLGYYGYPMYWGGPGLWAGGVYPTLPAMEATPIEREVAARENTVSEEDVHLRSTSKVNGYDIQATDDTIGHVEDFVFDDESWAIRYLVVDTRNWWPGGKRVLVATHWIDRIDWTDSKVFTTLTGEAIKDSPEYNPDLPLDRDYETRLHTAHGRKGYWI